MRFMAIIYGNSEVWESFTAEEFAQSVAAQDAWDARTRAGGELLGAYGLADALEARTVRRRGGAVAVSEGPYLETREHLASAYLLECRDLARAVQVASEIPWASVGAVEVWPVNHGDGSEPESPSGAR